jgi:hypothetical protein
VDLLWKRGNPAAALWLEEFWHRITARHDLVLLCGYGMRNFYKADDAAPFAEVCRLHTHVMPTEHFAKSGADVFERLRAISVLEQRARSVESELAYRAELERALRASIDAGVRARGALLGGVSRLSAPLQAFLAAARARLARRLARRRARS